MKRRAGDGHQRQREDGGGQPEPAVGHHVEGKDARDPWGKPCEPDHIHQQMKKENNRQCIISKTKAQRSETHALSVET